MKRILLSALLPVIFSGMIFSQKILFDNTKSETASNADWVIDHTEPIPSPAQSGITSTTSETYWDGAISAWGVEMVKRGFTVETLPSSGYISYGNSSNSQDLSNYDIFVVCEPNNLFSSSEKAAIMNFVQNGGGLFMVADHDNADRDGDGYDAYDAWNDLITNNSVNSNKAFGMLFTNPNYINDYPNYNIVNDSNDPLLHGPGGDVYGMEFHGSASMTIYPDINSTVKGVVFRTGYSTTGTSEVMVAYSRYGQGKVVGLVDSSPADDGTGNPGDNLYYGWDEIDNGILITNATLWLADKNSSVYNSGKTEVSIYPNPVDDLIIVNSNKEKINSLKLISLTGQILKFKKTDKIRDILDISELSSGIYFLNIDLENKKLTKKIIVKH